MKTIDVKWYHSMMRGAPILRGQAGTRIAVLDALLVNGFGDVTSTGLEVMDNVLTINLPIGETFELHSVVSIIGDDLLNGEYRVIESGLDYVKVKVELANQVFVNQVTVKYAPLGWSKIINNAIANSATYLPKETHSGFKLFINDNYARSSIVWLYKEALNPTNIVNYTSVEDYSPKTNNWPLWFKSSASNANNRAYFLIGDPGIFYIQNCQTNTDNSYSSLTTGHVQTCGDINRLWLDDPNAAVITMGSFSNPDGFSSHNETDTLTLISYNNSNYHNSSSIIYKTFIGDLEGNLGNNFAGRMPMGQHSVIARSGTGSLSSFNNLENKITLSPMLAMADSFVRGILPGVYWIHDSTSMDDFTFEEGNGDLEDRLLLFKRSSDGGSYNTGNAATLAYDITGPWR